MFCFRQQNKRINHLHERALGIVSNNFESNFENRLELDNFVSIHQISIWLLSIYGFRDSVPVCKMHGCY